MAWRLLMGSRVRSVDGRAKPLENKGETHMTCEKHGRNSVFGRGQRVLPAAARGSPRLRNPLLP